MDASGCSSHILSLPETIFLINACSSSVIFDPAPNAALETSNRDVVLFAPSPYPLVLPLPSQSLPPVHVAAAAGAVLVPMLSLLYAQQERQRFYNQSIHSYLPAALFFLLKLPVLTSFLQSESGASSAEISEQDVVAAFNSAARAVGQQLQVMTLSPERHARAA
jgi:hypothetical protein